MNTSADPEVNIFLKSTVCILIGSIEYIKLLGSIVLNYCTDPWRLMFETLNTLGLIQSVAAHSTMLVKSRPCSLIQHDPLSALCCCRCGCGAGQPHQEAYMRHWA